MLIGNYINRNVYTYIDRQVYRQIDRCRKIDKYINR